jgi:hypothetical protein
MKDLLQQAIDKGTTTAEEVHQAIARMPLDVLQRIAPNLPLAKTVADVQRLTIGTVYDAIRLVNKNAGQIAEQLLAAGEKPAQTTPPRPS